MFFDGWWGPLRIVIVGVLAYVALLLLLRVFGKRSLSKWNAYDLVLTVALGSTMASVVMSKDTTLVEGIVGFLLLLVLQYLVTSIAVRVRGFQTTLASKPTLMLARGRPLAHTLREQRVTQEEVLAAVRAKGLGSLDDVAAVVLETDGNFSVIPNDGLGDGSALADVPGAQDLRGKRTSHGGGNEQTRHAQQSGGGETIPK
ncbi:DUF421 domain-containing protein [Lysobacter sp. HA35]